MADSPGTIVRARAKGRCEYCRLPESESKLPFELDHVVAAKHGGPTAVENLALACPFCNSHKGPNASGFDPASGQHVRLFSPRADRWYDHFRWDGVEIVGITPIARATIAVLAMNHGYQVAARLALVRSGWFLRSDL